MKPIDLRSDTVTKPTPEMRKAMAEAEVGDDVYSEDPTVNRLEERAAELLGMEAALFVPSGTMGNAIAIRVLTQRGDEVLVERRSHVVRYELSGMSVLSGVMPRMVDAPGGHLAPEHVRAALAPRAYYKSDVSLVVLENTHNLGGGTVQRVEEVQAVVAAAREAGLRVHVDGARLWHAAVALGVRPAELVRGVDSVMTCLSKGLCAPVGSLVASSRERIAEARRVRKLLGGGMRQAGVIAAAGLVALDTMVERLAEDHEHARLLARALACGRGVEVAPVQTNIVVATLDGRSAPEVVARAARGRRARDRHGRAHAAPRHAPRREPRGLRARRRRAGARPRLRLPPRSPEALPGCISPVPAVGPPLRTNRDAVIGWSAMRQRSELLSVSTRRGLVEITGAVRAAVRASGVREGLCTVFIRHTSASLVIQENADPAVRRDLEAFFSRLVPDGDPLFTHVEEGEDDMSGHVKAALLKTSEQVPVADGDLLLGTWQGLYVWEHRGGQHRRQVAVHVLGE